VQAQIRAGYAFVRGGMAEGQNRFAWRQEQRVAIAARLVLYARISLAFVFLKLQREPAVGFGGFLVDGWIGCARGTDGGEYERGYPAGDDVAGRMSHGPMTLRGGPLPGKFQKETLRNRCLVFNNVHPISPI
jgi:hypothetical protein